MPKDPICGMDVNPEEAKKKGLFVEKEGTKNYFCSQHCVDKFQSTTKASKVPIHKSEKFGKVFPYFLGGILILGTVLSVLFDFMILYMGIFFIIFSLFKMPAWKGFVDAFQMYDIIAKKFRFYGWIYPGIEFVLGTLFIISYFSGNSFFIIGAWITLFIMGIGTIGVSIKLLKKEKFQCACLGTWINVPLTKITLLEDILMVLMALRILVL